MAEMVNNPDQDADDREAFARLVRGAKWPLIVAGLLGVHVFMMMISLSTALTIPAYYATLPGAERGMDWDELAALRRHSEMLGWSLAMTPLPQTELNGDRSVRFELTDRSGAPIPQALVELRLYHHARPQETITEQLTTGADGAVTVVLPMRRTGQWRLDAEVRHGDEVCLIERDQWLREPGGVAQ
ncbi:MAG: FixH family protein [Planctomycetota bacterium]